MPTYTYRCDMCETQKEILHRMDAVVESPCPKCASPMRRQIGKGGSLKFKGDGFYETTHKIQPVENKTSL